MHMSTKIRCSLILRRQFMLGRLPSGNILKSLQRSMSVYAMAPTTFDPPVHRGMEDLDRSVFFRELNLIALRMPAAATGKFLRGYGKQCACCEALLRDCTRTARRELTESSYLDSLTDRVE